MNIVTITLEHNGVAYGGQLATIKSTALGYEDHGILTASLACEWKGGGVSVGGYCLDESTGKPEYSRRGTAYGLDHLIRIMETVGVSRWEQLPGKHVIVLFEGASVLGATSSGIANALDPNKVLILAGHAQGWLHRESVDTATATS